MQIQSSAPLSLKNQTIDILIDRARTSLKIGQKTERWQTNIRLPILNPLVCRANQRGFYRKKKREAYIYKGNLNKQ